MISETEHAAKAPPLVFFNAGLGSKFDGINNGMGRYLREQVGAANVKIYTSDNNQVWRFSRMRREAREALKEGRDVVYIGSSAGVVEAATFAKGLLRFKSQREKYLPHLKVVTAAPVMTGFLKTLYRLHKFSIEAQHRSYSKPETWLKGIDIYDMFTTPEDPPREKLSAALERARPDQTDYTGLPVVFDSGKLEERYNRLGDLPKDNQTALAALRKELSTAIDREDYAAVCTLTAAQCPIVEPHLERAWEGDYQTSEAIPVERKVTPLKKGLEKVFGIWNLARGTLNGGTRMYRHTLRSLAKKGLDIQPVAFRHDPLAPVPEAVKFLPGKEVIVFEGSHATHCVRPPQNFDQFLSV